jgi:hypothetical protein
MNPCREACTTPSMEQAKAGGAADPRCIVEL